MNNQSVNSSSVNSGLEGVVVAETKISDVKGAAGELSYRGESVEALIALPFPRVVFLVVFGRMPSLAEEQSLQSFLIDHGQLTAVEKLVLTKLPRDTHPMLMLQSMVPILDLEIKKALLIEGCEESTRVEAELGLVIAAKIPTLIANWYSLQTTDQTVAYPHHQNFHENFLLQFNGKVPTNVQVNTLDATQILQLEHSLNASTFAGRVAASTQSPVQSVISVAIGTLYGRLHGGADQAAVEMAKSIGSPEAAQAYVDDCFARKEKIMGMGHREYKTIDPRAKILKPMARELCTEPDAKCLFETLVAVEDVCREKFAEKGKDIWANVEFYKGAVFQALGIPPHYFTAMFAMARVVGYLAHYLEFNQAPRLIRPQARYVGE